MEELILVLRLNWWLLLCTGGVWCLTCCNDGCPCYWHWGLPVGNPLLQGPCSVSPSLPLSSSLGILSGLSAALQFHSCLLWRRHTRRDEFRILHACLSACVSVCAVWGRSTCSVVSIEELATLRSQHKLSEYLSGANACFSILST